MIVKYLAIQTSAAGRPCGWGLSRDKAAAKAEARAQYASSSYAHEPMGEMLLHLMECEGAPAGDEGGTP